MPKKKAVPAVEAAPVEKNPAAVALGKRGGDKTKERGPDYYRKIAAKRKNFRGGRPKKSK